jgi:hypothetical protein
MHPGEMSERVLRKLDLQGARNSAQESVDDGREVAEDLNDDVGHGNSLG